MLLLQCSLTNMSKLLAFALSCSFQLSIFLSSLLRVPSYRLESSVKLFLSRTMVSTNSLLTVVKGRVLSPWLSECRDELGLPLRMSRWQLSQISMCLARQAGNFQRSSLFSWMMMRLFFSSVCIFYNFFNQQAVRLGLVRGASLGIINWLKQSISYDMFFLLL